MRDSTKKLIKRMYCDHGYSIENVALRLCIPKEQVEQLTAKYKPLNNKQGPDMIFPELPRHHHYWMQQQKDQEYYNVNRNVQHVQEQDTINTKAPLLAPDIERWLSEHNYYPHATGPAVQPRSNEPIDWLAKDAWEFYALCVLMIAWITYWYGSYRGLW